MNWTVYSKITGEVISHRVWPRGENLHLLDNQAAIPGHVSPDMRIFNGKVYNKIGPPTPRSTSQEMVYGEDWEK